jgi:hypothetical protein
VRESLKSIIGVLTASGAALLCAGCAYTIKASDGTLFERSNAEPDALSSALAVSASHDLPCASGDVEIVHMESEREYAVMGCGSRVVYRVLTPSPAEARVELVSRGTKFVARE